MNFTTFMFLTSNPLSGLLSSSERESDTGLLSNNYEDVISILSSVNGEDFGFDAFGGKDIFGSFDISNLNESFFASASQTETTGSIASVETAGSIACVGSDAGSSCGGSFFSSVG